MYTLICCCVLMVCVFYSYIYVCPAMFYVENVLNMSVNLHVFALYSDTVHVYWEYSWKSSDGVKHVLYVECGRFVLHSPTCFGNSYWLCDLLNSHTIQFRNRILFEIVWILINGYRSTCVRYICILYVYHKSMEFLELVHVYCDVLNLFMNILVYLISCMNGLW